MEGNKKLEQRGIEIVDVLANEGATYEEASSILKSAEWELLKRKFEETKNKNISKRNKAQ